MRQAAASSQQPAAEAEATAQAHQTPLVTALPALSLSLSPSSVFPGWARFQFPTS